MGKKADLLLKQLVEKDEEIRRLKDMRGLMWRKNEWLSRRV